MRTTAMLLLLPLSFIPAPVRAADDGLAPGADRAIRTAPGEVSSYSFKVRRTGYDREGKVSVFRPADAAGKAVFLVEEARVHSPPVVIVRVPTDGSFGSQDLLRVLLAESVLDLKEESRRPLTAEESESLPRETLRLEDILNSAEGKTTGARGILSVFFGKEKKPGDPIALLDAYEKDFPRGALAPARSPLRSFVSRVVAAREEAGRSADRAEKIVGSTAPDFTLKDLEGKDVSLKDFRGKGVLLSFWGYG